MDGDEPQSAAPAEEAAPVCAEPEKAAPRGRLARYVDVLQTPRYRACVVLFWVAVLVVGLVAVTKVFGNLQLEVRALTAARSACMALTWRPRTD